MESAGPVRAVVGPYQHDRRIQRFHTSDFFRLVSLCSRHFLLYISHYHPLLSFRLARNTLISIFSYVSIRTYVRSLGCQCWALGMRDGFVSLRLSRAASSLASLALTYPVLPSASPVPIPFPSNLNNAAASPLPLSPSITPSLSLARLIDPDPVLFSSLFDSRRVTRTDSPAASRRQGLPGGEERERGVGDGGSGKGGRTGPTHRSRDIHFHFIFLARYRRQKKMERERRRKKIKEQRAL